jgi:hypothetical protein
MTDDDDLLKQLGARVREERARASAVDDRIPPFDAAAEERIAAKILEKSDARPHGQAKIIRHPRARWFYAAAPLAAAAAMALFITTRRPSHGAPPAYEVSLVSVNDTRDPTAPKKSDAELSVDPDGELELVARPVAPVKGARARAFLVRSGDVKPWLVPLQISDEGAVRITGVTRHLFPSTVEPYDVVIIVAVGDSLPSEPVAEKLAAGAAGAEGANVRVIRAHIRFFADPQNK